MTLILCLSRDENKLYKKIEPRNIYKKMLEELIKECIKEVERIIKEKQKYISFMEEQQKQNTHIIDDKLINLLEYIKINDDN